MLPIPIGKHTACIDGDILFLELVGDLTSEEMERYMGVAEQLKSDQGHFFILDDLTRFGSAAPAVRKKVAAWIGRSGCLGAALYGASLPSRTVALLVIGAMKMLGSHMLPISFFKTKEEARDWVAVQRRKSAT